MNKEVVYDEQISPLMAEIIRICHENKIATLCSFSIPTEDDDGLFCATALLTEEFDPPERFIQALRILNIEPLSLSR